MQLKNLALLLLLPLAISACDSQQPSYSAAGSTAPPPPAATAATADTPPPSAAPAGADDALATRPAAPAVSAHRAQVRMPDESQPMTLARVAQTRSAQQPAAPVASIGVGPCDDYIARYRACADTITNSGVPNAERFAMMRTDRKSVV